jgi:uroporphyrin-III C-methyltransferase/precorrin-2 dehydrogenase/sirohydrochlorin ferrochelatase
MGVSRLTVIADRLINHGAQSDTPVAIIENGSRAYQQVTITRLAELADVAARGEIQAPALLIVGEVAALANELAWFGKPPRRWVSLSRQVA